MTCPRHTVPGELDGKSIPLAVARTLALAMALLFGVVAFAADADLASVRVDGRPVFRIGPTEEADARMRAARIEGRLETLLRNVDALGRAEAVETDVGWTVSVSGVPVVQVTARDAEDQLTTPAVLASRWAGDVDRALTRARGERVTPFRRFVAETRGAGEAAVGRLVESVVTIVPRALAAVALIALFWGAARLVRAGLRALFRVVVKDVTTESLLKQLAYYAVLVLGAIVAIDALGFEPQSVIAGLGITGLVLGFALKDVLSNFVSGVLIMVLRPFELDDQIVIGETEGTVERIELRATCIRTYDGRVAIVPNAEVFTSRLINNTADPIRRGRVLLRLGFDISRAEARTAVEAAMAGVPGVLASPAPKVRTGALFPDGFDLEVLFWADARRADFRETTAEVNDAVLDSLVAAGLPLPDPGTRRVYLEERAGSPATNADGRESARPPEVSDVRGRRRGFPEPRP